EGEVRASALVEEVLAADRDPTETDRGAVVEARAELFRRARSEGQGAIRSECRVEALERPGADDRSIADGLRSGAAERRAAGRTAAHERLLRLSAHDRDGNVDVEVQDVQDAVGSGKAQDADLRLDLEAEARERREVSGRRGGAAVGNRV